MSSEALEALRAVNAPSLSESDFARLYKGKLSEIIDLVAHCVVGRSEANVVRATIQRNRDLSHRTKPLSDNDPDPLYTASKRAETRLKSARVVVESEQRARNEQSQTMRDLGHDVYQMQVSLEDKRLTSLLLAILERKEKIRSERFTEIAKLLEGLRQMHTSTSPEAQVDSVDQLEPLHLKATTKPMRTDFTKDVLSALQAHTSRVSRFAADSSVKPSPSRVEEAEHRLLRAVAQAKGADVDNPDVSSTFQALLATGREQALHRAQYRSPISTEQGAEDIEDIAHRISEKEEELQGLADQSAALTLACAQTLQVVSHFAKEAVPSLQDSLHEESKNARGYVDALRLSIVNRPRPPAGRPPAESLGKGQTLPATISNLERTVKRAQATEAFLRDVEGLLSPDPAKMDEQASLIDSYVAEEAEVADRIARLLERKAKKAAVGHRLVGDVERLVAETALIAGGHV